ncbi:MAG TPA: hypothetical protein VMW35_08145 [Myxococcota bacterium]|jgi:hypothetical protein|nr:hypothetical protein [Myxococcota bacterium]
MARPDAAQVVLVIHDGEATELQRMSQRTLGAAIRGCQRDAERRVVVRLRIDDRELAPEEIEPRLEGTLDEVRCVEVVTRLAREIAVEGLESASSYAGAVRAGVEEAAAKLREGRVPEANRLLADALDALGVLVFAIEAAGREIGESARELDGLEEALTPWLDAIVPAHEAADWIRVADVLEYEVAPIVDRWRDRIVATHAAHAAEVVR